MEPSTYYYGKLKLHLERHIYKRGKYKGDAPMEARQRNKNHYRVADRGTHMAVRFHNTDIIRAYPDGKIMIDCNGWADHITTKTHLNGALPYGFWVASYKVHSHSQMIVRTHTGRYRYYDGITFDADGTPTTELKPFLARRIDKDQVAELNKDMDENGFREMFKVLWGQAKPEYMHTNGEWRWTKPEHLFSMPDVYAHMWLNMVSHFAFDEKWRRDPVTDTYGKYYVKYDPSVAWSNLMRWVKRDMYNVIETEVYSMT